MSRNITAKELLDLAELHTEKGRADLARQYEQEEKELQNEMSKD